MWQEVNQHPFLESLSGIKIRKDILFRVVHWQLAKRRSGTHETKEEADVRGSGRKIVRQKGSGRARQGSKRGPHMRGGAVIFGPHNRDYTHSLTKKFRKLGLKHAVAALLKDGNVKVFDSLEMASYKVRDVKPMLEKNFGPGKKILFVDNQNDTLALGVRNLIGVDVLPVCGLNVYDILKHDILVFSKETLEETQKRVSL